MRGVRRARTRPAFTLAERTRTRHAAPALRQRKTLPLVHGSRALVAESHVAMRPREPGTLRRVRNLLLRCTVLVAALEREPARLRPLALSQDDSRAQNKIIKSPRRSPVADGPLAGTRPKDRPTARHRLRRLRPRHRHGERGAGYSRGLDPPERHWPDRPSRSVAPASDTGHALSRRASCWNPVIPARRAATAGHREHTRLQCTARRGAQTPDGSTKGRGLRVPRLPALGVRVERPRRPASGLPGARCGSQVPPRQ